MTTLHQLTTTTPGLPCRTDTEPFFSTNPTERHYATQLCRPCPLLLACLHHALAADEQHGVWGGLDFEARVIGCGTDRGFRRHRRRGEVACVACQAAHDDAVMADRVRRLGVEHGLGGSVRGYWLHWRMGEPACRPCKAALARKSAARRARARVAAEGAVTVLSDRRPAEEPYGAHAGTQPASRAA